MSEQNPKLLIEQKIRALAEPLVAAEGMELLEVEYVREREGWVLRLYLDKVGGVGLEDCGLASRAVETALDVEDLIPHEYSLEVSSPGLNRPLTKPHHFERALGKRVKVKTFAPLPARPGELPRKNFTGVLSAVETASVTVEVEGAGPFQIPLKDIAKANLEFEF